MSYLLNDVGDEFELPTVKAPAVGSVLKKLMALNPALSAADLIEIIRESTVLQGTQAADFASVQVIDEAKALRLASAR
jgi:hypothetical protein